LPSTIMDSLSRNTSDNEQSKETSDESKKQPESKPLENKPDSSASSRSDDLNASSAPEASGTSTIVPPSENQQQKTDLDGSPPTTWLDNLAGSRPPTTNLDPITITTTTNASNSPASLNIEHFDFKDHEIGTPTVEDNISQMPF
ncbi:18274_t:CDS:1, partial [Acaulospora morrowiae]